jgi:hypothetical protein
LGGRFAAVMPSNLSHPGAWRAAAACLLPAAHASNHPRRTGRACSPCPPPAPPRRAAPSPSPSPCPPPPTTPQKNKTLQANRRAGRGLDPRARGGLRVAQPEARAVPPVSAQRLPPLRHAPGAGHRRPHAPQQAGGGGGAPRPPLRPAGRPPAAGASRPRARRPPFFSRCLAAAAPPTCPFFLRRRRRRTRAPLPGHAHPPHPS